MASTITRDIWTDDSGTAANPNEDGTIVGNTQLQNNIYARIDEMFAGAGAYATFTLGGNLTLEGGNLSVVGDAAVTGNLTAVTLSPTIIPANVAAISLFLRGRAADNISRLLFQNNTGATNQAAIDGAPSELRFSTGTTPTQRMSIGSGGDVKIEPPVNGHDFAAASGNAILARLRGRASDGIARLLYVNSTNATIHGAIDGLADTLRFLTGTTPTLRLQIDNSAISPFVRINSSPVQPGFVAFKSATSSGVFAGTAIVFDGVVSNVGGHYAPGTGIFTAPVPGTCLICAQLTANNIPVGETFTLIINTSNRIYSTRGAQSVQSNAQRAGTCVLADMDAGDTATITFGDATSADIFGSGAGLNTRFSARLLP